MPKVIQAFGQAVTEVFEERGWSLRQAAIQTLIDHNTLGSMKTGYVPSRGTVLQWAQGIGEYINRWMELADYPTIPTELLNPKLDQVRTLQPGDIVILLKEGVTELSKEDRATLIALGEQIRREEENRKG